MTHDNDYTNVILEDINAKFDQIAEVIKPFPALATDIQSIKNDVVEMKSDIKVIKAVLTDSGKQLIDHETRIAKLELA